MAAKVNKCNDLQMLTKKLEEFLTKSSILGVITKDKPSGSHTVKINEFSPMWVIFTGIHLAFVFWGAVKVFQASQGTLGYITRRCKNKAQSCRTLNIIPICYPEIPRTAIQYCSLKTIAEQFFYMYYQLCHCQALDSNKNK